MLSMRVGAIVVSVLILAGAANADGQSIYTAEMLRDLPAGGNLFALIETAQPEITTDRFNSGGLNAGASDKTSAFLASWSQTQYRIGDVTISSPVDGTPMLFPELAWWRTIDVAAGAMPAATTATGLAIGLTPAPAADAWTTTIEFAGSGGALSHNTSAARPPAIAAVDAWTRAYALTSGRALDGRLALAAGASRTSGSTIARALTRTREHTASAFANASFTITPQRIAHGLLLIGDSSVHAQASLQANDRWRLFGGYTARSTDSNRPGTGRIVADRLVDGPIPLLADRGGDERRVAAGTRATRANQQHAVSLGADIERTSFAAAPAFAGEIEERVDGTPARLWRYSSPGLQSRRHAVLFNAFVHDRFSISPAIAIDAALRLDVASGAADGAERGIQWTSLLPSVYLHWKLGTPLHLEWTTGVSRSADQLMLGLLASGDPAAPIADVYRDNGGIVLGAPLIARVNAGTIDDKLQRPITDQFALGLDARPLSSFRLSVMGLARKQSPQIHVVNEGVPLSSYTTFTIPDANADLAGSGDDQQLIVYNRKPESFGLDRYVLSNPDVEAATMGAVIVEGEVTKPHLLLRIGGTASASVGSGGNRGYTAIENDQSMPGELFTNPNAGTYARGRLFNDRAYTIKTLAIVDLPFNLKAGAIARYQDGQPFSRITIVRDLNQGAEGIQSYANGRTRFTYRSTLDVRLQKRIKVGKTQVDLIGDAYNLLNMSNEVEEYVVTGPRFRETTAVQPPRSFHLGARVTF